MNNGYDFNGKPSICLLGVTYTTNNLGVNALTDSAITGILRQFPNANITILDYGKSEAGHEHQMADGRRVPINVISMRFSKNPILRNNIALLLVVSLVGRLMPTVMRCVLTRRFPVLRFLEKCDAVAAAAGGDSFSDIYGLFRFFYVSLPQLLAVVTAKPLILLPQTVGPFRTKIAQWVARIILLSAKRIYARDYISLGRARDLVGLLGKRDNVQFQPDMAFTLPASTHNPKMEVFIRECTNGGTTKPVAVNVSGLLFMGGYSRANMFGLRVDYRRLMRNVIHDLFKLHSGPLVLLPHVFGSDNPESDESVCASLHQEINQDTRGSRVLIPDFHYDQREVKSLIANCEFVVASRMHVCIAALSLTVPAIGIAYSPKFQGVMESLNLSGLVVDPRYQDEPRILENIGRIYSERGTYRELLRERIPKIRLKAKGLFEDIGSLLSGARQTQGIIAAPRIIIREDLPAPYSEVNGVHGTSRSKYLKSSLYPASS